MKDYNFSILLGLVAFFSCAGSDNTLVKPDVVTDKVNYDTDDPAIWFNEEAPEQSLVYGTDKENEGSVFAFDLEGKIVAQISGLNYPNNVDIAQDCYTLSGVKIDILVTVERPLNRVRIFSIPELVPIDNDGITVFEGEPEGAFRLPMGVALYQNQTDSSVYLFVSRKSGPTDGTYIWQYEINIDSNRRASLELVRKFGRFSGGDSEIEALMVDQELGYVYYSDEAYGVRKYFAQPEKGNKEIGSFGQSDFTEDREGIALWATKAGQGYVFVSNQAANTINVYNRRDNSYVGYLPLSAQETDGIEVINRSLNSTFPNGMLVIMSDDKTFQYYSLDKLEREIRR